MSETARIRRASFVVGRSNGGHGVVLPAPKMMLAGNSTVPFAFVNLAKPLPCMALGLMKARDQKLLAVVAPITAFGAWLGRRVTLAVPERTLSSLSGSRCW